MSNNEKRITEKTRRFEKDEAEKAVLVDDEKDPRGVTTLAPSSSSSEASEVWCICDMPEKDYKADDPMVFCQGSTCKRKWFHFKCIGKATNWTADGDYYCPSCLREKQ